MFRKLEALINKILKLHEIREGVFYRYMPFSTFVSMCKNAYKKIDSARFEDRIGSKPAFLDMFCFRANTYNDPREGKVLVELSENLGKTNSTRGLLAELYQETELEGQAIDINSMVFIGCFVAKKATGLSVWAKKANNNVESRFPDIADCLPMWRDYANKGKGVCLEARIHSTDLIPMYRISYNKNEQLMALDSICSILKEFGKRELQENATRLREIIDPVRFLFKSPEHDYENEARIIEICGFDKNTGKLTSKGNKKVDFDMNLLENKQDPSLSRLYINFEDLFFKHGGSVIVGPAFEESDYLFGKKVIIEQVYYWLKKLNLLGRVEVKTSRYNIRF